MVDEQSLLEAGVFAYGDDPKVCCENRLLVAFVMVVFMVSVAALSKCGRVMAVSVIQVSPGQSIQEAINHAADGDTIVVQNGTHLEGQYPVIVNKSITLTGQNVAASVINGRNSSTGILLVRADYVRVLNLTIQNTTENFAASGISLASVKGVEMADCIVTNCGSGLALTNSSENRITRNSITRNKSFGVYLHANSSFNNFWDNNLTANPTGINIADTSCQHNAIYHNNFVLDTNPQIGSGVSTTWDDGYPSGGNYWDDHVNEDLMHGVGQNLTGGDGIADASYLGLDKYPLAEPVYTFYMYGRNQSDYYALISSNSTVCNFDFDPSVGSFLTFEAAGSDGTTGCCRVTVPRSILWVEDEEHWAITINGTAPATGPLILEDGNSTFFFFSYNHSAMVVEIAGTHVVPEYALPVLLLSLVFFACGFTLLDRTRARAC